MKPSFMDMIRCPVCKGELALRSEKYDGSGHILEGILRCAACSLDYSIEDGIPDLMPPEREG